MSYLFTSESVSEGHPDKVADAISDAVLDLVMARNDIKMRCACETLVTTDTVVIAGEYKGFLDFTDLDVTVRNVIREIGYNQVGFNHETVNIINLMHRQSPDIALGTDTFGAGDQGLMFGYATNETPTFMPAPLYYSHLIMSELTKARKEGTIPWLRPDAKSQVTVEYDDNHQLKRIAAIVLSTQHAEDQSIDYIRPELEGFVSSILPAGILDQKTTKHFNPTGRFVLGGPNGDTGLTGRKIIVDTYGGSCPHGGGAFSGKDPTKVDRSAAYMMRYLAKNIVASGKASKATCQISYAIGVKQPTSFYVKTEGGNDRELEKWILNNVDLTPKGIIDRFNLFRPIYHKTTNLGHFGKDGLPWEEINLF